MAKDEYRQLTIMDVIRQFDERNYTVKSLFAGAGGLDCGAPQNRKRLIIIGSKHEFDWDFTPVPEKEKKYLRDIMESGVDLPLSQGAINRLSGKNKGQWPAHIYDPAKKDYGPTCVAHYAKDQSDQLTVDPGTGKVRSFTVKEYARLQGSPDDYPFAKGKVATLKQIGNAVSPYMAKAIGKEIIRYTRTAFPDMDAYNNSDASPDDFVGRGFPVFRTGTSIAC